MYSDKLPKEIPHHLSGLVDIHNNASYPLSIDESECADIAFKLAELSLGKNKEKNIEDVLRYIKNQHASLKRINNEYTKLLDKIVQWIRWAAIWTLFKNDKPETN